MDSFDLDTAKGEGWAACDNGEPIESNPYIKGHFLHEAWDEGWRDCFEWSSSNTDFGAEHLLCLLLSIVVLIITLAMLAK